MAKNFCQNTESNFFGDQVSIEYQKLKMKTRVELCVFNLSLNFCC